MKNVKESIYHIHDISTKHKKKSTSIPIDPEQNHQNPIDNPMKSHYIPLNPTKNHHETTMKSRLPWTCWRPQVTERKRVSVSSVDHNKWRFS